MSRNELLEKWVFSGNVMSNFNCLHVSVLHLSPLSVDISSELISESVKRNFNYPQGVKGNFN